MSLERITIPLDPVSLAEAKLHCRIDGTGEDELVSGTISAATEWVQAQTRQQLCSATYRLRLDSFPDHREIRLPKPPLQSVASVKYVHTGIEQALDPNAYTVDPSGSKPGRIILKSGQSWPATDEDANAVRIIFNAGYGAPADVPFILRQAVKLMTGLFYEQRESAHDRTITVVPLAIECIVDSNKFVEAEG